MPRKTRPRAVKAPELTVLFTTPRPDGGTHIALVRGAIDPSTPNVPASRLIWANLDALGRLQVNVMQRWDDLDTLPDMVRDAVLMACGDEAAKARLAAPRVLAPGASLVGADGSPLLLRNGHP